MSTPNYIAIMEAVEFAIAVTSPYLFEIKEAKAVIVNALQYYFDHDCAHLAVTGVECEVELSVPSVPRVHGYTDIRAVTDTGERIVIDWKTTGGELDSKWVERQVLSWQWRFYAHAVNATHFLYRGLSRNGSIRTIVIEVPPENSAQVERHLLQSHAMREGVKALGLHPWPRNMPEACNAYGRPCPYLNICRERVPLPYGNGKPSHSYSSLKTFALCPERSRLDAVYEGEGDTEEASFGRLVHAGLAAAYRSAFAATIIFPRASK